MISNSLVLSLCVYIYKIYTVSAYLPPKTGKAATVQEGKHTSGSYGWLMCSAKTTWEKYFGGVENITLVTKQWVSQSKPWVLQVFQLKGKQVEDCLQANRQLLPQAAQLPKIQVQVSNFISCRIWFFQILSLEETALTLGMQMLPILSNSQRCFEQDARLDDLLGFLSNQIIICSRNPNLYWTNLCHKKANSVRETVSSTRMESNWCQ